SNTARRTALLLLSGLLLSAPLCATADAQTVSAERPSRVDPYAAFIAEAAQRFGTPEHWIRAVMRVESAGDVRAISSAGAMGLMQIMPATWTDL
uniref:transglycosylase SLT domain-containing protein n=2 Tax=Bacteria TaxID=2 RepID=UPI0038B3D97C